MRQPVFWLMLKYKNCSGIETWLNMHVEWDAVRVANNDHVEYKAAATNIPAHAEI
jgi:hypothetical protein